MKNKLFFRYISQIFQIVNIIRFVIKFESEIVLQQNMISHLVFSNIINIIKLSLCANYLLSLAYKINFGYVICNYSEMLYNRLFLPIDFYLISLNEFVKTFLFTLLTFSTIELFVLFSLRFLNTEIHCTKIHK